MTEQTKDNTDLRIRQGELRHRVLESLDTLGPQDASKLFRSAKAKSGNCNLATFSSVRLTLMEQVDLIKKVSATEWGITPFGKKELSAFIPLKVPQGPVVRNNLFQPSSTYNGRELGQTCLRPGAYDAFALPSLIGKVRTYKDKDVQA